MTSSLHDQLATLGVSTVYEAASRSGLLDIALHCIVPGAAIAGPVRTVLCGQDDNLMMHAVLAVVRPGDVLVVTMPTPTAVALVGELLATQAQAHGVAALLIDGAVRDVAQLRALGLPIWARSISARGATRTHLGAIDGPITVGGTTIQSGDTLVLNEDGAVTIPQARVQDVLAAAHLRAQREQALQARFARGELSIDIYNLRRTVAGHLSTPPSAS